MELVFINLLLFIVLIAKAPDDIGENAVIADKPEG